MSKTLELPDDVYAELEEVAARFAVDPATWVADRVRLAKTKDSPGQSPEGNGPDAPPPSPRKTLAELLEGVIGSVDSGGLEAIEERCRGDSFAEYLLQKKKEGRL
jgi:hypothetical protein